MKTAILGAGAMGCLVGAHIKKGGGEVYFVDMNKPHMDAIARSGLHMEIRSTGAQEIIHPDGAVTDSSLVGVCDLVIVLVKCMVTEAAIASHPALFGENTVVISLQNGLGNAENLMKHFPAERVGHGLQKASALQYAPGKFYGEVRFPDSPYGVYFAPILQDTPYLHVFTELERLLNAGGMPAKCTPETDAVMWDKLYDNAIHNAIGALLQVSNEDSDGHPDGLALMEKIGAEVCAVGSAKGLDMDTDAYWKKNGGRHKRDGNTLHYSSAVVDAYLKRPIEIDFINGAVVAEGKKLGIPTPYNEAIWHLVRIMQDTYDVRYKPREG